MATKNGAPNLEKKSSMSIDNTSRNVGAGKTPNVPSTIRGENPGIRTQQEIGGELGHTVNDRG